MNQSGYSSDSPFSSSCSQPSTILTPSQHNHYTTLLSSLQSRLIQFQSQNFPSDLLIHKNIIPYDLLQTLQKTRKDVEDQKWKQAQIDEEILEIMKEILELERVGTVQEVDQEMAKIGNENSKRVHVQGQKSAQMQQDLKIKVQDQGLQSMIAQKAEHQRQMMAILQNKLQRQQKNVQNWRKRRLQIQNKKVSTSNDNSRQFNENKLVEDRVILLEQDINRLTAMIEEEKSTM